MGSSTMTAGQYIADLVAVQGLGIATVAAVGSALVFNADMAEAISFGAVASLATSVGDWGLTVVGSFTNLETYMPFEHSAYLDPMDFLAGGLTVGAFQYLITGVSGPDLYKAMAIGAVAGGTGRKLAGYLHNLALGTTGHPGAKGATQNN